VLRTGIVDRHHEADRQGSRFCPHAVKAT
jgi:hypothetical protein